MFKYLLFFSAAFYLVLLIGGEDRGQQRMGLQGAYSLPEPQPAMITTAADSSANSLPQPTPKVVAQSAAPTDSLRVLPVEDPIATIQPASLSDTSADSPGDTAPAEPLDDGTRFITADAANVRAAADRAAAVIGRLERDEIVRILETSGDWVHVRIEGDGIDGYVHRRLISSAPPALTATTLFSVAD